MPAARTAGTTFPLAAGDTLTCRDSNSAVAASG